MNVRTHNSSPKALIESNHSIRLSYGRIFKGVNQHNKVDAIDGLSIRCPPLPFRIRMPQMLTDTENGRDAANFPSKRK